MTSCLEPWQRVLAIREGGHVERAHCMPHIGSYSVASHSWNAVALLLQLHPDPSKELISYVMFHDVAERWTGDIPYPARKEFPNLGLADGVVSSSINEMLRICTPLSPEDEVWLHGVDMIEFLMWCNDQLALGNTFVQGSRENADRALRKMKTELPEPLWRIYIELNCRPDFRHSDWIKPLLEETTTNDKTK